MDTVGVIGVGKIEELPSHDLIPAIAYEIAQGVIYKINFPVYIACDYPGAAAFYQAAIF